MWANYLCLMKQARAFICNYPVLYYLSLETPAYAPVSAEARAFNLNRRCGRFLIGRSQTRLADFPPVAKDPWGMRFFSVAWDGESGDGFLNAFVFITLQSAKVLLFLNTVVSSRGMVYMSFI